MRLGEDPTIPRSNMGVFINRRGNRAFEAPSSPIDVEIASPRLSSETRLSGPVSNVNGCGAGWEIDIALVLVGFKLAREHLASHGSHGPRRRVLQHMGHRLSPAFHTFDITEEHRSDVVVAVAVLPGQQGAMPRPDTVRCGSGISSYGCPTPPVSSPGLVV